jgi:selenocysteine-specific elongation factor
MAMDGFQPATPEEAGIEPDLARAMANLGWIVEIGDGIAFLPERLSRAREELLAALAEAGSISLAEYRDRLGTTRRYAQALLEYFDRKRVTRRTGDRRVAIGPIEHREEETAK